MLITGDQRVRLRKSVGEESFSRAMEQAAHESIAAAVEQASVIAAAMGDDPVTKKKPFDTVAPQNDVPISGGAFGLSHRELEVLSLMVQGLTHRQIGNALFINHGTARTHVGHALGKLGVRKRAMAVRVTHEHRLV